MFDISKKSTCLHQFVEENAEALQNAALMLGGRPWLKRVHRLFEALRTESFLRRRIRQEVTALHGLLAHAHDPSRSEAPFYASLDPASPWLEEISLLANELGQAIDDAYASQPSPDKL